MKELKKAKGWLIIMMLLFLIVTGASVYFIYAISLLNGIENTLRFIVSVVVVMIWLLTLRSYIRSLKKRKISKYIPRIILSIIYVVILIVIGGFIIKTYSKVDNLTSSHDLYSTSIVTLKSNKVDSIKDMNNKKIGRITDETSVEGYTIPEEIIDKNNLKNKIEDYDTYTDLLDALLNEKIDYVFLPTDYVAMFSSIETYAEIGNTTKIIYTQTKEVKAEKKAGSNLKEPFTILLMGVDSEQEDVRTASYNGDSLMLITFNPKTLSSTILSIPRDTYVPIACMKNQRKNKITHAAWQGESCMINTIQNFTGITIDYYVKINFKGVVKLVDSLGGIEVDVPLGFCEQDSDRNFGNLQCVEAGHQVLNGEQALAWARHRKSAGFDDFVRGQNQQLVVKGILNQLKNVRSLDTVYELMDTLGNNMQTNMTTNEILSLYNIGKDVIIKAADTPMEELLSMQRLYISGSDAYIYDYDPRSGQGTRMNLYNFVPYEESLQAVIDAMKVNLGLKEPKMIKEFSFDINEPYEETIIGKMNKGTTGINLLPDFSGDTEAIVRSWGSRYGFTVAVKQVASSRAKGTVISQSIPAKTDMEYVKSITINVSNGAGATRPKDDDEDKKETPKPTQTPDDGEDDVVKPTPTPTPDPTPPSEPTLPPEIDPSA
ncbi:MAG TPA: LCP family protein [Candidatus Fimihabitans intestinipullorum]|uniref:LCP family protein n=1 Tax=Candidatus Fimihabitans intestinipullorum TaxID=2840820 RepID=A0A9D1HWZ4_9BACT|nr:LCP family protein [Candidatus Fimihabitans intestinipullorum]